MTTKRNTFKQGLLDMYSTVQGIINMECREALLTNPTPKLRQTITTTHKGISDKKGEEK